MDPAFAIEAGSAVVWLSIGHEARRDQRDPLPDFA